MRFHRPIAASTLFLLMLTSFRIETTLAQDLPPVIISEVRIGETDSPLNEFIELYNRSDETLDISGWKLQKKTSAGTASSIASIDKCIFLPPKKHFVWAHGKGRFAENADKSTGTTSGFLSRSNTFEIADSEGAVQDSLSWGEVQHDNESAERNIGTLEWTFVSVPTPTGHEYVCQEDAPEETPAAPEDTTVPQANAVRINEVLPDPSDTEEFIELFNFGENDIDLKGWSLHDASKTGKYTFEESAVLKARSYLTLFRETFSFALNNTNETVTLFDPQNKTIDTVAYAKSGKDASYGLSSSGWRWSGIITPDAANRFNEPPSSKTAVPKHIYRDTPAEFIAKGGDGNNELKYLWNFDDGHTSRLASVMHTYSETGTYHITLAITDAIEETIKKFTVKVRKLPKIHVSITGIGPNPPGTDTGNEWISIRNDSKKKVDLSGWSIAAGTAEEKLANHPFKEKMLLAPNEERTVTSDLSAFSLPNENGVIELRQPNKKAADTLRYGKPGGIGEGEIYRKSIGNSWSWTRTDSNVDAEKDSIEDLEISENANGNADSTTTQAQENLEQTQSIATTNGIIDAIDTLSADELSLLRTQIDAKMKTIVIAEASANISTDHQNPIPRSDVMRITADSSLLAKEPLVSYAPTNPDTELVRYLNRTMNSFLKKVR